MSKMGQQCDLYQERGGMKDLSSSSCKTAKYKKSCAAYYKGVQAEETAATLLQEQGYQILSKRFRSPEGELDLVAACADRVMFVEVKRRKSLADAAYAITPRQQRRIARAAEHWLLDHPDYFDHEMSFDAVLVAPGAAPCIVQDAFRL